GKGIGRVRQAQGEVVRVRESEDGAASGLGQGDGVIECGIGETKVVIERIVDRVIDAAGFTLAAVADVQRGNSEVLQEWRVIGTGSQRVYPNIGPFARFPALVAIAVQNAPGAPAFSDRYLFLGVDHIARNVVHEPFERV